jgi:trehalose/maltose hydrolase-like predicted phosphorylase
MRVIPRSCFLLLPSCLAVSWTLIGTEFNQTSFTNQPYVANGYIGLRVPAEGFGYAEITPVGPGNGTNGWPVFDPRFTAAMVAGFYDVQNSTVGTNYPQTGGEQVISTLPTWSSLYCTINGETYGPGVDPSQVSNYRQSMSIQNGIVSTALTWTPPNGRAVELNYTIIAHRTRPNLGVVRLDVAGLQAGDNLTVTDLLDVSSVCRGTISRSQSMVGCRRMEDNATRHRVLPKHHQCRLVRRLAERRSRCDCLRSVHLGRPRRKLLPSRK